MNELDSTPKMNEPAAPTPEVNEPPTGRARTGKIARLPQSIREDLNRRLEDGQEGGELLEWLHSLPAAKAVLHAKFGGRPISKQNLSEWRQGGFRAWQRAQERHALVREWTENDGELTAASAGRDFGATFSRLLLAELAQATQQVLEETADAKTRLQQLQEIIVRLAQLRREEANAERARIVREKWAAEVADREEARENRLPMSPETAYSHMVRYLEYYGKAPANRSNPVKSRQA